MLIAFTVTVCMAELVVRLWVPVRSVGPVGTTYHPVYGKALKKSYSCVRRSPEFTYRLTTNSLGFRGPEPESPPKGAVLFIGDSMTMGTGVNDGEDFPDIIRRRLDEQYGEGQIAVINAGVAHNGNGRWIKLLRNEAELYEPRFVFLETHHNDFRENVEERLFKLGESEELVELPVPPRGTLRTFQAIVESLPVVRSSYLLAMVRQAIQHQFLPRQWAESAEEEAWREKLTHRIIEESLKICAQRGWPVIGITAAHEDERAQRLQELFRKHGAPVIQVPPKSERPDLYFEFDPHWHADGQRWVADVVYEQLTSDPRFQATIHSP